ncbi:MAG: DUF5667 domain-containing protein [Candidatus Daviesbacteria bacterium]|nr:DUF5667 domain-containing protein [Candidatus Daviesbacteria bacterium]
MVKKLDKFPILFFLFLSGILIFCWFRFGLMYGGGDTGLPTYNPLFTATKIASNIWWDSLAPGIPVAQGLTSVPMLFLLSIPQVLGASPVVIQALLFFVLLFLMGYGMHLLALSIFGKPNYLLAISAGVFYLFNPYMMIQIWHRFIHNSMFFVAFLPFLIMTWLWWIRKRSPVCLLLFLLVNFLAVYVYGTIAFIVPVWTLLFFLTLLEGVVPWKGRKNALRLLLAFLIGCFFWLLTNSWWLIPTFSVSPALFASVHTTDGSLNTLMSLSNSSILPYTLRLVNPFYLYWLADWGSIYQNPIFLIISWLFVPVVFIGFIRGLKQTQYVVWSLLLLVVIYLSKGAAPPFNFPYIWGFSHFFPLGVIRNPFEKLGIILPLVYAILFSVGLQYLLITSIKFIGKSKTYFLLIIFICLHMAFFWPMFAGKLFGTMEKQNFVEVPPSYTEANNWIKQDLSGTAEGRILHLPLPRSESVTYNWGYGYNGVEPSAAIFTALPSIARGLDIPGVNDALSGLSLIFHKPYAENNQFVILKMLQDFNVKYIILHKDIRWLGGELYNPLETETVLDNLDFLDRETTFGDLTIYKLKDSYFSPKIKLINNIQYYISPENNTYWPLWLSSDNVELLSSLKTDTKNLLIKYGTEMIVSPEIVFKYIPQEVIREKLLVEMPVVRILPDSPLYPSVRLKENLQYSSLPAVEKFSFKVTLAGKRLIECYLLKEKGSAKSIIPQLREYQQMLPEIKEGVELRVSGKEGVKEISINFILARHLATLKLIGEKTNNQEKIVAEEVFNKLINFLKDTNVVPNSSIIEGENLPNVDRLISKFNLPFSGKYELLQAHQQIKNIYPNKLDTNRFQINNELKKSTGSLKGDFISYGLFDLPEGFNEISFNSIPSINLAKITDSFTKGNVKKANDEIELNSGLHDSSYIDINVDPVYGGNWYRLTFDSWIKLGNRFRIQILQDIDPYNPINPTEKLPLYDSDFSKDPYINHWVSQTYNFHISPTTTKVIIRLEVEPWDGCTVTQSSKKLCMNKDFSYQFERLSQVTLRNIRVVTFLTNPLFLQSKLSEPINTFAGEINFIQKNIVSYSGKVRISKSTWMLFKESFDPGWELSLIRNKEIYKPSQHLIANLFANVWLIEQPGDYDFVLKYSPQKFIKVGMVFAGLGLVIVLIFVVGYNFRRLIFKK